MFKSLLAIISNLLSYINVSRSIELGRLRERERVKTEFESKKALVDEIRRNNPDGDDVKWLYPPKDDDK